MRAQRTGLDGARILHDVIQQVAEFGEVAGFADFLAITLDLLMVVASAFGNFI